MVKGIAACALIGFYVCCFDGTFINYSVTQLAIQGYHICEDDKVRGKLGIVAILVQCQ